MPVAVASRSFSRHPVLRQELLARHPEARFNDGDGVLAGAELVQFLRGHDKAITGLDMLTDEVFAGRARAAARQQVRRRPRHDRSRRGAAPRRLRAMDAGREPSGGRRARDRVHDRARPQPRAARARDGRGWMEPARRTAAVVGGGGRSRMRSRGPAGGAAVRGVRRDGARARHPRVRRFLSRRERHAGDARRAARSRTSSRFICRSTRRRAA